MALYRMRCTAKDCGFEQDRRMAPTLDPRALCATCGQPAVPVPSGGTIVRAGDDWVGKGMELRAQMARRAAKIKQDAPLAPTLRPNVGGDEVGSWGEAARLAASRGLDPVPFERMAEVRS